MASGGVVMSEERRGKRVGCLVIVLIIFILAALGTWKVFSARGPGKTAKQIISGPVDPVASATVNNTIKLSGVSGAEAVMVPLPGEEGNAAIIVLDTSDGFEPPAGEAGKRKQAMDTIRKLVEANKKEDLNIQQVGVEYQENGKPLIALAAPMDSLEGLVSGQLTEKQFLAQMEVKVKDVQYFYNLAK